MIYTLYMHELTYEPGEWIAMIDPTKDDATHGMYSPVKYGMSEFGAYDKLRKHLEKLGHEIRQDWSELEGAGLDTKLKSWNQDNNIKSKDD